MNNLLILSCGTRDLLVRYFKKSSFDNVIGADCSELAPALYEADRYYIIPRMSDPQYFDAVFEICQKEGIRAVLPLQEDELQLIAENRKRFEDRGIRVIVSEAETIELCRDKYHFLNYMESQEIPVLKSYEELEEFQKDYEQGKIDFPVFVKPVRGAGSIGAMKVMCMEVLEVLCTHSEEPLLIQEFCEGQEFGVDAYIDMVSGETVALFAKEKLRMRAGETEKSITCQKEDLRAFALRVIDKMNLSGPVDMDIFQKEGTYYISEINPRFGGGFPHAYACGMDTPNYLARNMQGIPNESHLEEEYDEVYVLKYSDIMVIEK